MKKGFTLTEILIVVAILIVLLITMAVAINPGAMMGRANDARRKKDIGRMKVAFEEYFNDTGCFPSDNDPKYPGILTSLKDVNNCNSGVFSSWGLSSWPCDPVARVPYYIFVENVNCPSWFKIITNLNNHNDDQIPDGWYTSLGMDFVIGDGSIGNNEANFGVSSPNVIWYETELTAACTGYGTCYWKDSSEVFHSYDRGSQYIDAYTANFHPELQDPPGSADMCKVPCCFDGSICQ